MSDQTFDFDDDPDEGPDEGPAFRSPAAEVHLTNLIATQLQDETGVHITENDPEFEILATRSTKDIYLASVREAINAKMRRTGQGRRLQPAAPKQPAAPSQADLTEEYKQAVRDSVGKGKSHFWQVQDKYRKLGVDVFNIHVGLGH